MSVVIIGGHDRMVSQYKKICKEHSCKAKVFTQMPGNFRNQIGSPDLIILFTNTVSHKMVKCAVTEAEKSGSNPELGISSCLIFSQCILLRIILEKNYKFIRFVV